MSGDKPLAWLHGEIKTPPFSATGRVAAGGLLRRLQHGEKVGMPHSRPLPPIRPRCHELRLRDQGVSWRIIYRTDEDAIVILDVFAKTSRRTPPRVIAACRDRMSRYDELGREKEDA